MEWFQFQTSGITEVFAEMYFFSLSSTTRRVATTSVATTSEAYILRSSKAYALGEFNFVMPEENLVTASGDRLLVFW